MYRKYIALILALACLAGVAGGALAEEQPGESLYTRGLEVVRLMSEIAGTEAYVGLHTDDDAVKAIAAEVGGQDHSAPKAVYEISFRSFYLAMLGQLAAGGASEELRTHAERQYMGSLAAMANGESAGTLAASVLCSVEKTFVDEDFEGVAVYLYTYEDAAPVLVTFAAGDGGAVSAQGSFLLGDFACGSAEEAQASFDALTGGVTGKVTEIQPGE